MSCVSGFQAGFRPLLRASKVLSNVSKNSTGFCASPGAIQIPSKSTFRNFTVTSSRLKLPDVDDAYRRTSVQNLLSLKGKTTVVTGGGRGIGLAVVRGCVEAGGDVAVLDALPSPHNDYAGLMVDFPKCKIKYYQTDVADMKKLDGTFSEVVNDFGRIDNCVTAAGIVLDKPFLEHQWDETLRVQTVNVRDKFLRDLQGIHY